MQRSQMLRPIIRGAAAVALLSLEIASAATPKDTLVIAREISSISDWDPAVSQILDTQEINGDVYERLVGLDPRDPSAPLTGVVASKIDVSTDGKQFTFTIREGIKFHSGNPLSAADVEYTFKRVLLLDREPASTLKQIGLTKDNIDSSARATSANEFVLTLPEPYAKSYILSLLSSSYFGIVDKKLLEAHVKDNDFGSKWLSRRTGQEPSAGSGPFRITAYRPSEALTLQRNEGYWRFKPPLQRVIFRHIPESGAQRLLLERGDADMAFNLTAQDIDALQTKPDTTVQLFPSRRILYFGFNMATKPFDDPRVLQAMKYLIDYEGFEKTLMRNQGKVHQTFIPASTLGALKDRPFKYDPDRAKALLAQANVPQGMSFRLSVANRRPEMDMATAFQSAAAKVGVKVDVVTLPPSQLIPLYRDRKVDALMLTFSAPYGDPHATASKFAFSPAALPGAKQGDTFPGELTWRLGYAPKDLSLKVIEASKIADEAKRSAAYGEIQRAYWQQAPFAQTFQSTQAVGMRKNVMNYRYGALGADVSFAFTSKP